MVITPRHATPLCVRLPIGVSLQQFVGDLCQSTSLDNDGAGARQSRLTENNFRWLWIPGIGRIPNPWDAAHAVSEAAAARGYSQLYVEPDLLQTFPWTPLSLNKDKPLEFDKNWRPDKDDHVPIDWHLDSSKLRDARRLVGNPAGPRVRVGHLDTGYSAIHETKPVNLQPQLGVNLVEGGSSTVDPAELQPLGNLLFPGHGTFTIALLAGARCTLTGDNLGGAPFTDVVPIRVSNSVVQFLSSAISDGIEAALAVGCDIITLSMGGVPSLNWACAVNKAYEAGCTICAAAGSNLGGFPIHDTVWPARWGRVIGVSGVTFDHTIYYRSEFEGRVWMIEGNFGPADKSIMDHQIAAYAPNLLAAKIYHQQAAAYGVDGNDGTSGPTPQVAAAAALYFQKNLAELRSLPGWQRCEAVRFALLSKADPADPDLFGRGLLNALSTVGAGVRKDLPKTPEDTILLPAVNEMFEAQSALTAHQLMLAVEAAQVASFSAGLGPHQPNANLWASATTNVVKKQIFDALGAIPNVSKALSDFVTQTRGKL